MKNQTDTLKKRYWCMISTDGIMNMQYICNTITTQDEVAELIYSAFAEEFSAIIQDDVVFGPHAIAWLEMNALVDELPINNLASDLSEMIRKDTMWPHPIRGNVAFINAHTWNSFN